MSLLSLAIEGVERGWVPDFAVRSAIRDLCAARLRQTAGESTEQFVEQLRGSPIALATDKANEQHYEVPAEFFAQVLGLHRKYSCCYWLPGVESLDEAEAAALRETCSRAEIADGMEILELGCGWGSLSLWMAEHYPQSRITAVSNSASQRQFIEGEAARRGLGNLRVLTADMNTFDADGPFDRVISVEMFEHMRNYEQLLERIAGWLKPDGKLFVHVFCHRKHAYPFESEGAANWMGRYFFTGGIMPSQDLLCRFNRDLQVSQQWLWSGGHYQKTAEAWLTRLDARQADIMPIMRETYGPAEAGRWFQRWRLFFLAVSELFGYRGGSEWFVAQYLLIPVAVKAAEGSHASMATSER